MTLWKVFYYQENQKIHWEIQHLLEAHHFSTAWKVSKHGVFSGPYFPAFGLNTERYTVSLRIQSKCGKIRTRKKLHIWTLFTLCWPCAVPLRVSPRVPVAFDKLRRLVLHWGHTRVIMCNGGLRRRMHKKSSLQIICTYRQSSNSGHVSDALWKT